MSPRRETKNNRGAGLLNTLINRLPWELHLRTLRNKSYQFCGPGTHLKARLALGQTGINKLDSACREHDIAYEASNDFSLREKADRVLENRAWEIFKSGDTGFGEKAASWAVTAAMKAKGKMGAGCGFKKIVGAARKAIAKSLKTCPTNINGMIKIAIAAAKKKHAGRTGKKTKAPRIIRVPKRGGVIGLIPILAGLSALGSLVGGAANVVKAMENITSPKNGGGVGGGDGSSLHLGSGLYFRPYSKSGAGYKITKCAKKKNRKTTTTTTRRKPVKKTRKNSKN